MNNGGIVYRVEDSWSVSTDFRKIESGPAADRKLLTRFIPELEAKRILAADPTAAGQHAREALKSDPRDPQALFLLGAVLRREGQVAEARAILQTLVESLPHFGQAWYELGLALARLGHRDSAIEALLRAIDLNWMNKDAWLVLGSFLTFPESAEVHKSSADSRLAQAKNALRERRADIAENIARDMLRSEPENVHAIKFLADLMVPLGRWAELAPLLARCLEVAPDFAAARFRYATLLFTQRNFRESLPQIDELLKSDPDNILYRALKALALGWSRQFEPAIAEFESFIDDSDSRPGLWFEYARLLRNAKNKNAIFAYKKVFEILPSFVDAYVSLAHSKSIAMDESIIDQVCAQLANDDLGAESRAQLHFVLGKAFEDLGRYAESFKNYSASNKILCCTRDFGIEASNDYLRRAKAMFTPGFFRARRDVGCPEHGAIFIVGMPRSGSTLVEQIISAHSKVEGLGELDHLPQVITRVAPETPGDTMGIHPYVLVDLDPARFRLMGEEYMAATRRHRKTGRPFFTDKMPHNYTQTGLIHLALPNARIIDVRRHPLDCCFSCFKQYFPGGQPLTMTLHDVGRAYANYVELMAHFDDVLPGKVHRVIYENLIENFEEEVRRLLQYIGLPFEDACLRFHENERLVNTISHEQVRMPLYKTGMAHWRRYGEWLAPLKEELGYILDIYPEVPKYYPEVSAELTSAPDLAHTGRRFNLVQGLRQVPFEIAS